MDRMSWRKAAGNCALLGALVGGPSACASSGEEWVLDTPDVVSGEALSSVPPDVSETQERLSLQSENGLPSGTVPVDRTITLGETTTSGESSVVQGVVGSERGTADQGSDSSPNEQMTNSSNSYAEPYYGPGYWGGAYVGPGAWGPTYWDGGSGRSQQPASETERSAPQSVHIGQDWPSVPNYGPAFPFRTAPASPWAPGP